MAPASRGTGERGLCPSVVAMQGGCDSSPCCGPVALSRRRPGLGMTVGPNRGGPFDQLATANLTTAGGQPSESLIFEPRPRGAVVLAFRQGCVCLVAGGGQKRQWDRRLADRRLDAKSPGRQRYRVELGKG